MSSMEKASSSRAITGAIDHGRPDLIEGSIEIDISVTELGRIGGAPLP